MYKITLSIVAIFFTAIIACDNSGSGGGSPQVSTRNVYAKDASDTYLGIVTGTSLNYLYILNEAGYQFITDYNANSDQITLYYSESNCTGTGYARATGWIYSYSLFYDTYNSVYKTPDLDGDNKPVIDASPTVASKSSKGVCSAYTTVSVDNHFILETISKSEAGLPETITGPIFLTETKD